MQPNHTGFAPEVLLASAYASAGVRDALKCVFELDRVLADIAMADREAIFGQMRLAWWREELGKVGVPGFLPADPLLVRLNTAGIAPEALVAHVNAWEGLMPGVSSDAAAGQRGEAIFAAIGGAAWAACGRAWGALDRAATPGGDPQARSDLNVELRKMGVRPKPLALGVFAYLSVREAGSRAGPSPLRMIGRALRYAAFGA